MLTRLLPILLALALLSVLAPPLAAQQPAVPNAGFEQGKDAPDNWSWREGEGGRGEFTRATAPVHGGQYSLRVRRAGASGYTALDSGYIPVVAGKTYRVSAWIYPVKPVRRGVYFMITQHTADSDADQLPNTFGTTTATFTQQNWQQITVSVTVREGITRLRIHCIQAMLLSDVYWDDFAVAETAAAEKPRYEPPLKETLPDLAPAQAIVAKRPRAQAKMQMVGARPRLLLDGKPTPFAWYVSPFGQAFMDNAQINDFRQAGVHVYLVPLVLGNGLYGAKGPWLGKGQYDFSVVDELIWRVLRVDPQGYVIFYMCCDPYPAWGAGNPDDVTQDQNGQRAIVWMHPKRWGNDPGTGERFAPSLTSLKLRADVSETLRRLVAHVESSEAGKAVAGYHVAGFNDGQWFQWASLNPADLHLADYCPGAQRAFREWLRHKYLSAAALQRAWARPEAQFETAAVPGADKLWADPVFVDPRTEQQVADYQRFYSEGVAENIMALASLIKQQSRRPVICGTYCEDITCNSANHIALGRFLNSPALDYTAGPAAYGIRMAGYQGAVRNVFGSTLLHGKQYLTEQDWRSWHSVPNEPEQNLSWGRAETAEIHNAMVRRECGMMLAFGIGTWWYDMSGGWFRDDGIMSGIAEAVRAFTRELSDKDSPRADLAVFVSEESDSYVRMRWGGQYRYQGIVQQIEELNTAGVPYRLYLQSDLGKVRLPDHKAYLFLNPYLITAQQRQAIEGLKRGGKLLAFVHSPGRIGAADPALAASSITGMKLAPVPAAGQQDGGAAAPAPDLKHPLLQGMEDAAIMVAPTPEGALAVTDPAAAPLAPYQDRPALGCAARDFGTWKSVFIGSPGVTAEFLHNLAAWAGCWVAAAPGDAVYGSQHFLTIHALFPGRKVLRLPQVSQVTDLTTGEIIAERTDTITLEMPRAATRWFRLEPR